MASPDASGLKKQTSGFLEYSPFNNQEYDRPPTPSTPSNSPRVPEIPGQTEPETFPRPKCDRPDTVVGTACNTRQAPGSRRPARSNAQAPHRPRHTQRVGGKSHAERRWPWKLRSKAAPHSPENARVSLRGRVSLEGRCSIQRGCRRTREPPPRWTQETRSLSSGLELAERLGISRLQGSEGSEGGPLLLLPPGWRGFPGCWGSPVGLLPDLGT